MTYNKLLKLGISIWYSESYYGTCIVFDVVVLVEHMTCSMCGKSIFSVFSKVKIVKSTLKEDAIFQICRDKTTMESCICFYFVSHCCDISLCCIVTDTMSKSVQCSNQVATSCLSQDMHCKANMFWQWQFCCIRHQIMAYTQHQVMCFCW